MGWMKYSRIVEVRSRVEGVEIGWMEYSRIVEVGSGVDGGEMGLNGVQWKCEVGGSVVGWSGARPLEKNRHLELILRHL